MGNMLKQLFSENNGNLSSMRLLVSAIILIQMLTWAGMCFKTGQIISWDLPDVGVLMAALGAKALQKGRESN